MRIVLDKFELFLLCFIAFVIPVSIKFSSVPMILLFIIALLKKDNHPYLIKALKSPSFYILIIPYIFLWLGLLNSENIDTGLTYIIRASSLVLFPVIFAAFQSNKAKYKNELIFSSFILGVLVLYIICLNHAIPVYLAKKDYNVFFYQEFSEVVTGPHHMSYFVIFALVILISNLLERTSLPLYKKRYLWLKVFLILIFSVFLFQLSSKATIILYILISFFVIVFSLYKKLISLKIAIPIVVLTFAIITFGLSTDKAQLRFLNLKKGLQSQNNIDHKSQESTVLRMVAYKAGGDLIKNNFWFGVGTGDIIQELDKFYLENDYQKAYALHTDPHNQFVRTFASNGVFAFLGLVSIFVLIFYKAIRKKHFLLLLWGLICLVLFNVEDMFSYQRGVMFFSFFTSYFIFNLDLSNNNQSINT